MTIDRLPETQKTSGKHQEEAAENLRSDSLAPLPEKTSAALKALQSATGIDPMSTGFDKKSFDAILKNKSQEERQQIESGYNATVHSRYGTLENTVRANLKGADLDESLAILRRKDGDMVSQRSNEIARWLDESRIWLSGHSQGTCEKQIRTILSTSSQPDLKAMDNHFASTHNGQGIYQAVESNPYISAQTKKAVEILLGRDKDAGNSPEKITLSLAQLGINSKHLDIFQEAMANAAPETRDGFRQAGGNDRLLAGFGMSVKHSLVETPAYQAAHDYSLYGKLAALTQLKQSHSSLSVESAISNMDERERQQFIAGKALSRHGLEPDSPASGLTALEQGQALAYYRSMHSELLYASGNATDQARWEDSIASKGGSFVSSLADHNHLLWHDSVSAIQKSVENMSQGQWQDMKDNRKERLESLHDMLTSFHMSGSETKAIEDLVNKRLDAATFQEARTEGRRPVTQGLADAAGITTFTTDTKATIEAIHNMSPGEQQKYQTDPAFRAAFDKQLKWNVVGQGQDVASICRQMLEEVKAGKPPEPDIVSQLKMNSLFDHSPRQALRDLQQAFGADPALRQRVFKPEPADRAYSQDFRQVMGRVLGTENKSYGETLLSTGSVPSEAFARLDRGNLARLAEDLSQASLQERNRLQTDRSYQDLVLGSLSSEERKVAMAAIQQGELKIEDRIRARYLESGGSNQIAGMMKQIAEDDIAGALSRYASKYSGDFALDVLSKTSGQDHVTTQRVLDRVLTCDEQFDSLRHEYADTRNGGFGAWLTDSFSITGSLADEGMKQSGRHYKDYREVLSTALGDPAVVAEIQKRLDEADHSLESSLDSNRAAKARVAEYASDIGIGALGIGSVIATGGTSLPLILSVSLAGGLMKVGTNALIQGNDYKANGRKLAADFTSGVVSGAATVIGPQEIKAIFDFGKQAAADAVKATLAEGIVELEPAAQAQLARSAESLMEKTLASGAPGLPSGAFREMATNAVAEGIKDRAAVITKLTESLQAHVQTEFRAQTSNWMMNLARQQGYYASSGFLSGAAGGGTSAYFNDKPVLPAIVIGGTTGMAASVVTANVLNYGARAFENLRGKQEAVISYQSEIPADQAEEIARSKSAQEVFEGIDTRVARGEKVSVVRERALATHDTTPAATKLELQAASRKELEAGIERNSKVDAGLIAPKADPEPVALLVMGLPAGGKTGTGLPFAKDVLNSKLDQFGGVMTESDRYEYLLNNFNKGEGTPVLQKAAAVMNDQDVDWITRSKKWNVLLSTSGMNKERLQNQITNLRTDGYDVKVLFVEAPAGTVADRAITRFDKGGRFVDPAIYAQSGHLPAVNFQEVVKSSFRDGQVSEYFHILNWKFGKPVLMEQATRVAGSSTGVIPSFLQASVQSYLSERAASKTTDSSRS